MSQIQNPDLLRNHLLQQSAVEVLEWLNGSCNKQEETSEEFNWWLGLAQGAAFNARKSEPPSLAWSQVAIFIYDRLAAGTKSIAKSDDVRSAMMLRVYMILRLGNLPEDPVLDIARIICWFFETLDLSLEEANKKANDWHEGLKAGNPFKTLSGDDVRELRHIKNRLNVVKELAKSQEFRPQKEMSDWLNLWEKLP